MKRLITLLLLVTSTAYAEPVVLAIQGQDIYVDIGAKDGVGAGSELELMHEVTARDPRSGSTLKDRFALGTITVIKSGAAISVARADEALTKRVLVGDQVRLASAKRTFVDPWLEQVAASKGEPQPAPIAPTTSGPPIDHAALARQAWQDTLGQPYDQRIARWAKLLEADPQSPYRRSIEAEIASLKLQMKAREAALDQARTTASTTRSPRVAELVAQLANQGGDPQAPLLVGPIEHAVPGRPIELAFLARSPAAIKGAWLYVRPSGAPGFTRIELARDGDAYLRGTIAGTLVKGPRVEWYVEAKGGQDNDLAPVVGSQQEPRVIVIDDIVEEDPIYEGRTHIDGHMDYVDFDGGFNKGFDQYTQAELDFTYRFFTPVYAVRLGWGALNGTGGPKDVIDADRDRNSNMCLDESGTYRCQRMSFSYVYTELELRVRPNVAVMIRPQAGVLVTDTMSQDIDHCQGGAIDPNDSRCQFFTGFGARGRVRLGKEYGTNLVLGAAFTSHIGTLLEAAYNWLPNKVVPVQITVQVTDQPVVEDFGVRLIADVGVRKLSWFYPSARLSYQARDLDHSGLSGGFALNFDW
ncbi:MAG TPA: hypothetical protein VIV40_12765 [Kofleriaceae bacterium]